jgi:hypothetical protein
MKQITVSVELTNMTNIKDEVIMELVDADVVNSIIVRETASVCVKNEVFKSNEQIIDLTLMTKDVVQNDIVLEISAELF